MWLTKYDILKLLPSRLQKTCLVGVADPKYYDNFKPIFIEYKDKWSGCPADFFNNTKAIIVLIHFTPVAFDYRVEKYIISLSKNLFKKYNIRSHLLTSADESRLLGVEWGLAAGRYKKLFLLKEAAYYAGLGQFGRNSLLINNKFGSDFKIQALLIDKKIFFDKPLKPTRYQGCLDCEECIRMCPSLAIKGFAKIDPKRCVKLYRHEKPNSTIVSRVPYKYNYYLARQIHTNQKLAFFKKICRACQAFCIANDRHYKKINIHL